MQYDFDSVVDRRNTNSVKWDILKFVFGTEDILPMWIADMDFQTTPTIIEALKKLAEHGIFGYSMTPDSYHEAIIGWMKKRNNWKIKKEWIIHVDGVVPAIYMAIWTFTEPGDQIVIQTPAYHLFFPAVEENGREVLENPLRYENGQYLMDLEDLEAKITPRTKMILLCSPHNPVGRVWKKEELERLGEFCIKNNILVLSDEIHSDLIYEGHKHIPFSSISEEFANNSMVCIAASKSFNLPALRVSNTIIPNPELREYFKATLKKSDIKGPNIFGRVATQTAYDTGEPWLEQLLKYLQGNIDFMMKYIEEKIPRVKATRPQGTYLVWLDLRDIGIDPAKTRDFLRLEAKVGLSGGVDCRAEGEGFWRMNIACPRSVLEKALQRLEKAINSLPGS
ncbi:MAG: pyridoxal phosphate-dependent aminotransferase [Deltaproteobacteria bacterium]|nr:pyridoxal phosphate-dependent aminotransferase [Deltaproteobacteria bacterium]